jgi:hypothetical protein
MVKSRVKCESAVDALRRRSQEAAAFDDDQPTKYSLTSLNDLAGLLVLVFPRRRIPEIDRVLRTIFASWTADPVTVDGEVLALTYHCYSEASERIRGEYQIVSMLTGLFWEVQHAAIYKPAPRVRKVVRTLAMEQRSKGVSDALKAFEDEFESLIHRKALSSWV